MRIAENDMQLKLNTMQIPLDSRTDSALDPIYIEYKKNRTIFMMFTLTLKRIIDLLGSAVGLIILSPLFLVVSIAIKLDSPGSVFFKQRRLGLYGKEYNMFKFRTMCQNAEKMETGLYSFAGDPRITRVGNLLRKSSIDELAQLINVFIGNMSLVGPRPPVINELGDFTSMNRRYKKRFRVKTGMTGLAQVVGRNKITWDNKVNYDNQYIEKLQKQSIWIDIVILFKTVGCLFKHKDIIENKIDETLDDVKAAEEAEKEIIRIAHMMEEEDLAYVKQTKKNE
jgi:lipopolysaccharide/colanic/teichoic acid biosynthesis glycosyltransferase